MNLIVAVDENWGIGINGNLLARIPADLAQFKEKTLGKIVVMGRKTLESFPNVKPLSNRTNIVITNNKDYAVEGVTFVYSFEEALEEISKYPTDDVFIIGGGTIYEQFEPLCNRAYISKIKHAFEVDTYFPNLDEKKEWKVVNIEEEKESNGYVFGVYKYEK
jgi:dihydrofolate reductase